jgi:hypothetical protein
LLKNVVRTTRPQKQHPCPIVALRAGRPHHIRTNSYFSNNLGLMSPVNSFETSTRLLLVSMVPLLFGICIDLYLIAKVITKFRNASLVISFLVLIRRWD